MRTISLDIDIADSDLEEQDRLTRLLRKELLATDVQDVELVRGKHTPRLAKGDPYTVGGLLITLSDSSVLRMALNGMFGVIRGWIARGRGRRITIKAGDYSIELSDAEPGQQQQLVDAFVRAIEVSRTGKD